MRTQHDGDCSIYSDLTNRRPEDGICTCGFGLDYKREHNGDDSQMYSEIVRAQMEEKK